MRSEKAHWRDQWISERHRIYGFDCPAVDVDFLMIEYSHCLPMALIEYKHVNALINGIDFSTPNIKALHETARRMQVPFAVVFYCPQSASFQVHPLNGKARWYFKSPYQRMSEVEYVSTLYTIRRSELPDEVRAILSSEIRPAWRKIAA